MWERFKAYLAKSAKLRDLKARIEEMDRKLLRLERLSDIEAGIGVTAGLYRNQFIKMFDERYELVKQLHQLKNS